MRRNRATRTTFSFVETATELLRACGDVRSVVTLSRPRNKLQNYADDVRSTSVRFGSVVAGGILALTTLGTTWTLAAGATRQGPTLAAGTVLTNTSLGGYTQIDQIDMLSPTLGYALATGSLGENHYSYYLARTTNLGISWTVQSKISANLERYPIYSDYNSSNNSSSIDFLNARVGYVNGAGGSLDVTNDGGVTWSQITPANSSTSYATNEGTTSVVVTICPNGGPSPTSICKSEFVLYRSGSTTPLFTTAIPVPGKHYEPNVELLAAAPHGVDVLNVNAGNVTTPTALRITHNNGRTWETLANPCASLAIEQLLVASNGTWLLSCFLDEGMSQGPGRILRSTNDGRTWTTEVNYRAPNSGKPYRSDSPMALFFSGNDRLVYAAVLNPAGGLALSANDGRNFIPVRYVGYTGGAPGSISNLGPTSSIYQVFQGPTFVTRDERTWHILPALRAGPYQHLSICAPPSTRVSWRSVTSGGLQYHFLDFTNHGATSCYLNGAPTIQPLNEHSGALGPPATTELYAAGGDFVVLKAHGGVANVSVLSNAPSNRAANPNCAVRTARALAIDFAWPSHFHFDLTTHSLLVCTTTPSISLNQVHLGRGRP